MNEERAQSDPRTAMRRHDRSRDDHWISEFISHAPFCQVATVEGDQPFITSVTFAYDQSEHALYFHTAKQGRLRLNTDSSPKVCVAVSEMGRLLPARTARSFSVEYRSAIVFGRISIVEDSGAALRAMQIFTDKYFSHLKPGVDYRPIQPVEIEEISVYRVDIESWTGKEKKADPDFPGAFFWE